MGLFRKQLGVDLGTINVLIYENGQIVLQEPSLVALTAEDERIVEIGQPAREMLGKVDDEDIQVVRPLRDGVIADYEVTEVMLRHFFDKIAGRVRLFKPTVMITVPYGVTSVEKRAVHEAALSAGAREAFLIWEPLAAAIGAGLPVSTPAGDMPHPIPQSSAPASTPPLPQPVPDHTGYATGWSCQHHFPRRHADIHPVAG